MLEIQNVFLDGCGGKILRGISLSAENGEWLCITGRTGCGKTALGRVITGEEKIKMGKILWDGEKLTAVQKVSRNFPLPRFKTLSAFLSEKWEKTSEETEKILSDWQLSEKASQPVRTLSDGEKWLVSLLDALFIKSDVLVIEDMQDENLFEKAEEKIRGLQKEKGTAVVFLTSDPERAMKYADKIALLCKGQPVQFSTPQTFYDAPETTFAAEYFGRSNQAAVEIAGISRKKDRAAFETAGITLHAALRHSAETGDRFIFSLRPRDISITAENVEKGQNVSVRITEKTFLRGIETIKAEMPWGGIWVSRRERDEESSLQQGQDGFMNWRDEAGALTPDDGQMY